MLLVLLVQPTHVSSAQEPQTGKPPQKATEKSAVSDGAIVRDANVSDENNREQAGNRDPDPPWSRGDIINRIIAVITALYFFATVGILLAMMKSNRHAEDTYKNSKASADADRQIMRDQLEVMRRQIEISERPWVMASIAIDSDLAFVNGDARLFITPTITNVGKSVATNIVIVAELIALPLSDPERKEFRKRVAALQRPGDNEGGVALFPGEVNNNERGVYFALKADIEAFCREAEGAQLVLMAFIGAIFYRFATSESDHETRFAYLLSSRTWLLNGVEVGATLASSEIFVVKDSGLDSAT